MRLHKNSMNLIGKTLIESGNDVWFLGKWKFFILFFMEFCQVNIGTYIYLNEFCFVFVYISKFQSAETETLRQAKGNCDQNRTAPQLSQLSVSHPQLEHELSHSSILPGQLSHTLNWGGDRGGTDPPLETGVGVSSPPWQKKIVPPLRVKKDWLYPL